MDTTTRVLLAGFIIITLVGGLGFALVLAKKQKEQWANTFRALSEPLDGLDLVWAATKDVAPFQKKYPTIAGTHRDVTLQAWHVPRPNSGGERLATHTLFQAQIPGLPAGLNVSSTRRISPGDGQDFKSSFKVKASDNSALGSWLGEAQQQALMHALSRSVHLSLSERMGLMIYFDVLVGDEPSLRFGLDLLIETAQALSSPRASA